MASTWRALGNIVSDNGKNTPDEAIDTIWVWPRPYQHCVLESLGSACIVTQGVEHIAFSMYQGEDATVIAACNGVSARAKARLIRAGKLVQVLEYRLILALKFENRPIGCFLKARLADCRGCTLTLRFETPKSVCSPGKPQLAFYILNHLNGFPSFMVTAE